MSEGVKITVRGPALTPNKRENIITEGAHGLVRTLVELGAARLNKVLSPRPQGVYLSVAEARKGQASTGNYRRHLNSIVEGLNGILSDGGVIYGPWLETGKPPPGRSSTRFKGYASFRKTKDYLNKQRGTMGKKAAALIIRKLRGI